jgi:hypothetical protein
MSQLEVAQALFILLQRIKACADRKVLCKRILRLLGITLISPAAFFDGVCRKDLEAAWGIYLADLCSPSPAKHPQYMNAIEAQFRLLSRRQR